MTLDQVPGAAKLSGDVVSASIILGAFVQGLPHIAAALAVIWQLLRLYETPTVRRFIRRRRLIARLRRSRNA